MPGLVTITAAPASTALTTIDAVKDELQITDSSTNAYLTRQINMASAAVARHCGRQFGYQTISETFRFGWNPGVGPLTQTVAPYGTPLNIHYKPLVLSYRGTSTTPGDLAVTSVTENGTVLVADTDFEVDAASGLVFRLRNGLRSWWGIPLVVVVYTAGYVLPNDVAVNGVPSLPAEVESVAIALVRQAYNDRGRDTSVTMELQEGIGRTVYSNARGTGSFDLDDNDLSDLLADYVRREA